MAKLLYDVIIRGAMLIDISSWKRSLQAYGIRTREIWNKKPPMRAEEDKNGYLWFVIDVHLVFTCVLLRQPRHSYVCVRVLAIAISPQRLHTCTWYGSDASNRRSLRNWAAPWAIWQSRSISPNRRPPSLRRQFCVSENSLTCTTVPQTQTHLCHYIYRQVCDWPWSSLHGLPIKDLDGAPGPWVDLIVHHVL